MTKLKKEKGQWTARWALGVSSILEWTHCTSLLRIQPSWTKFPILKMGTELCNPFNHCPSRTKEAGRFLQLVSAIAQLPPTQVTGECTRKSCLETPVQKDKHQPTGNRRAPTKPTPPPTSQLHSFQAAVTRTFTGQPLFTVKCSYKSGFMQPGFHFMGDYILLDSTFYKAQFLCHLQAG